MEIQGYELSIPNILIAVVVLLVILLVLRTLKHIIWFLISLAVVLVAAYLLVGDIDFILEFFIKAKEQLPLK